MNTRSAWNPVAWRWVWIVLATLVVSEAAWSQSQVWSRYMVSVNRSRAAEQIGIRHGDIYRAHEGAARIEPLKELFEEAKEISSGKATSVAFGIAQSARFSGQTEVAAEWYGIAAEQARRTDSDVFEISPSVLYGMMQGEMLARLGRVEEAAEAMVAADYDKTDPYLRYQLMMQAAHHFATVDRREDVASTMSRAVEHIRDSDRGSLWEEVSALQFIVDNGPLQGEHNVEARLEGYLEIHNDERYVDSAARLDLISRPIAHDAWQLKQWQLLDDLSEQILDDVMRLIEGADEDAIREASLDQVYMQTSYAWASGLIERGRLMEAIEVMEAAMEAFPDSSLAPMVKDALTRAYRSAGVEGPEEVDETAPTVTGQWSFDLETGEWTEDPSGRPPPMRIEFRRRFSIPQPATEAPAATQPVPVAAAAEPPVEASVEVRPVSKDNAPAARNAGSRWVGIGLTSMMLIGLGVIWRVRGANGLPS